MLIEFVGVVSLKLQDQSSVLKFGIVVASKSIFHNSFAVKVSDVIFVRDGRELDVVTSLILTDKPETFILLHRHFLTCWTSLVHSYIKYVRTGQAH